MTFTFNIKFGTVEPQLRYVPIKNGLKTQSRRVEMDLSGAVTLVTDWEDLGTSITWGEPERVRPWWSKLLSFKPARGDLKDAAK